jgi:hypothetical protein
MCEIVVGCGACGIVRGVREKADRRERERARASRRRDKRLGGSLLKMQLNASEGTDANAGRVGTDSCGRGCSGAARPGGSEALGAAAHHPPPTLTASLPRRTGSGAAVTR